MRYKRWDLVWAWVLFTCICVAVFVAFSPTCKTADAAEREPFSAQKVFYSYDHISYDERGEWYRAYLDAKRRSEEMQREYERQTWMK